MRRGLVLVLGPVLAVLALALLVRAAPAAPAVTPIVGGATWDTAVAISPGVVYEARVDTAHLNDWFYFNVTPGQILTLPFTSTATWGSSCFTLYNETHTAPQLAARCVTAGGQSFVFHWMGNNLGSSSTPSRYYFTNKWFSATNVYRFSFTLADQHDGGKTGDAGDTFANALVLALTSSNPSVKAPNNRLGGSDSQDYYMIKLPPLPIGASPQKYRFFFRDLVWPANFGGYINIQLYDKNRVADVHRHKLIIAPAVTPFDWDLSDCGEDGCFISFTSSLPNKWYQIHYNFEVVAPKTTYLPYVKN